jgi:hypothetical protein
MRDIYWTDSKSIEIVYKLPEPTKLNTVFWWLLYEGCWHFSFMSARLVLSVLRQSNQYITSKIESSHIGPMILETDYRVTYHEDEKIHDEEYESVIPYCWVTQLPWDAQLWKTSIYIATRRDKIFNRRPHAQSLYCLSKRSRRIILKGSTIQHCESEFADCMRCLNKGG